MPAPARLNRAGSGLRPGLYGNDALGDCTCAGLANAVRAQAVLAGFDVDISDEAVLRLYADSCGYRNGDPTTDLGGVETDVLGWQLAHGFDAGGEVPLVGEWATIDAGDLNAIRNACAVVGCVYLGVQLALADQEPIVWDTATVGEQTPGSWGGHCLLLWDYQGVLPDDLVTLITWGRKQKATWRWLASRMDEAHAVFWRQLLAPTGLNAAGLDHDRLRADCAAWAAIRGG